MSDVTRIVWWNVPQWLAILLYLGTAVGLAVSALALARHARTVVRGRPIGPAPGFRLGPAVGRVLADVLSHRRLLEDRGAGWAHALLFYGFLALFIGTCLVFVHDRVVPFLVGPTYLIFSFLLEWAGLAFLTGVGWAAARRLTGGTPRLERSGVALGILALLGAIGVTGFLLEAARIAVTDPPFEAWSFVGWTLARALRAGGVAGVALHRALWGVHAALCWLFFGLIGATVLRHMVAAPVQLALRQLRAPGRLAPSASAPDPAPLEPTRLTWAQLLDAATCVRCGRCTAVCPATAAGKPLDPRRVVQATLQAMREGRPLETLVSPEEAWSCTTCAACVRACPFEIEVLDKLVDLRRALVERGAVDAATTRALESTIERGNPFGGVPADRVAWAADLGVRVLRPGEATDVLYWVGCAGAFDPHGRRIARATARLLQAAGVDFAILGSAETCTGDPARRIGDETAFREAAGRVAGTLGGVRFQRLVTHCAHCFHVFRNELAPAADGAAVPAVHHTQLFAELVRAGRLAPRAVTSEPVTLHDPCYLARHNGEIAAPRAVLATGSGGPVEMPRSGERTFCCGAGGGGAWVEVRQGSRIAALRMAEARATGASVVATACPFCALMLAGETQPGDIAVRDVAELLWESQPAGAAGGGGTRPERS